MGKKESILDDGKLISLRGVTAPSSAEVKNGGASTSITPCFFVD
jgi:hypothetical protein